MGVGMATIGSDWRLELSDRHTLAWKPPSKGYCVVEIVATGRIRISALEDWAADRGMSAEEAKEDIEAWQEGRKWPDKFPTVYLAHVIRKKGRGRPLWRIRLPAAAMMVMFEQGEGPLASKFERKSAQVLVRPTSHGLHVLAHRGNPWWD